MKDKKKSSGLFMKVIVIFCIAYVVFITEQGLWLCWKQGSSANTIVCTSITAFIVELALCVTKRIFSKEDKEKEEENNKENLDMDYLGLSSTDNPIIPLKEDNENE